MLEYLLVCIRRCSKDLCRVMGRHSPSVVYLHLFQYLIMAQALRYFHEDAQDGGGASGGGGERARSSYVPTLASSTQVPGETTSEWTGTGPEHLVQGSDACSIDLCGY